ncbi:MAG: hypothetical protein C0603_05075 [Denitrovibrio sp.]|nr:MAG: hypothetical protein C0603_05075 [Denitrovibrio sp.]
MDWEFSAGQIIDGEFDLSLTDFTKKLYSRSVDLAVMSIDASVDSENMIDSDLDPLEDHRIQYFICYYNYILCLTTGKSRRQFKSHTKKLPISKGIKEKFLDNKNLAVLEEDSKETVLIFMAVLKSFVGEMMESGTSTNRLPQMLLMQQLNSFSSIIPSIMKNENARNMLIHIEFEKTFLNGRLSKIFK